MPDLITTPPYRMRGLEDSLNLDPLEELHAAIEALVDEQAFLQARKDNWDGRRKQLRYGIARLIVNELKAQKIAPPTSDAALERLAGEDPRYKDMMDEAEAAFQRLAILNSQIQNLRDRVARGNALARAAR